MANIETDNCLRKKASEYVIEKDLIIAAPKSKIITYLPAVKNQVVYNQKYPKINIDIQDLLDINLSDNQSIVSFYNKYGDLGLLSEFISKFVNQPIWLKTLNTGRNENFLGIYQPTEQIRNSIWIQSLEPLTIIPVKFPKSTFNSKINSIATDEEIIKYAQVKPQNASATYNSNLIDFIEKIETNDSEMQKFFPNLKKNSSEIQNKTVYPTPYTKLYFKHYAEDLNTIKFVLEEIKNLIRNYAKFGENINENYQESDDPNSSQRIKLRQVVLNSQPKEKIIQINDSNTNEKKWEKLLLFNSLISMFTYEAKTQALIKNWKLCVKFRCQKPFIPKTKTQSFCSNSCRRNKTK